MQKYNLKFTNEEINEILEKFNLTQSIKYTPQSLDTRKKITARENIGIKMYPILDTSKKLPVGIGEDGQLYSWNKYREENNG